MKKITKIWGVIGMAMLAVLGAPASGHAALYCVEAIGITPQCLYDDARQCRQQAQLASGTCMANPAAITATIGGERFCVVGFNGLARCIFMDVSNCQKEALLDNSVCMRNTQQQNEKNPYRYELNTIN